MSDSVVRPRYTFMLSLRVRYEPQRKPSICPGISARAPVRSSRAAFEPGSSLLASTCGKAYRQPKYKKFRTKHEYITMRVDSHKFGPNTTRTCLRRSLLDSTVRRRAARNFLAKRFSWLFLVTRAKSTDMSSGCPLSWRIDCNTSFALSYCPETARYEGDWCMKSKQAIPKIADGMAPMRSSHRQCR